MILFLFIFIPKSFGKDISTDELKRLLEERKNGKEKFFLIDVRTEEEHKEGHIPGTDLNIPHDKIESIKNIIQNKETKLILYCRSGRRSQIAKETLKKLGYKNVINAGGIKDWKYEIQKGKSNNFLQ
jgi:rhodanese-related sulfurtransferase